MALHLQSHLVIFKSVCKMPHRSPRSSPPLVGVAAGHVAPGNGVRWGRQRQGLAGTGRALRQGAVLLCGWTIVWIALVRIHLLVAEADAHHLSCRLPLAARHRALSETQTCGVSRRMLDQTSFTHGLSSKIWRTWKTSSLVLTLFVSQWLGEKKNPNGCSSFLQPFLNLRTLRHSLFLPVLLANSMAFLSSFNVEHKTTSDAVH